MEGVLFDMDGVVVDPEAYRVEREEAWFEEVAPDAEVEEITGMNYRDVYEHLYEHAAATLGVDSAGCVAVEGSVNGARAAAVAGMACVGYRADGSDLHEADRAVAGPDELRAALFDADGSG